MVRWALSCWFSSVTCASFLIQMVLFALFHTTWLFRNSFTGGAGFNPQRCDNVICHQLQWHYQVSCETMAAGSPGPHCWSRVTAPAVTGRAGCAYRAGIPQLLACQCPPYRQQSQASPEFLIPVHPLASALTWMGGTKLS